MTIKWEQASNGTFPICPTCMLPMAREAWRGDFVCLLCSKEMDRA